jgi:hypothetical protein
MAFTIKPNRQNTQWIKRNSEKNARKGENAALESWTAEGSSATDETNARMGKKVSVNRQYKPLPRRYHQQ